MGRLLSHVAARLPEIKTVRCIWMELTYACCEIVSACLSSAQRCSEQWSANVGAHGNVMLTYRHVLSATSDCHNSYFQRSQRRLEVLMSVFHDAETCSQADIRLIRLPLEMPTISTNA